MKSALKSSNGPRISQASKRVTLTSPTSSPDKSRRMTNDELTDIPTAGGGGYSKKFESKKAPQKTEPPIMEAEKDKLVKRFMDKISEQAEELLMLNSTLESSAEYIHKCESRISELENSIYAQPTDVREEISKNLASTAVKNLGDIAYQRKFELEYREKIEALTKQLTLAEAKNHELNEANIALRAEVERYKKENKQLEKKYQNSMSLQRTGTALDTTMRLNSSRSSAAADSISLASGKSSLSTTGGNSNYVLKQELRNTKEKLSKTEKKVSAIAAERDELTTRIKLLEDALDHHVEEMGLSGQADLLAKIAALRGEVLALQDDLARSKGMLSEAEKCREVIAQDKNYLEEQIESIYQRLNTTQEENARIKATSVQEYLEQVERERNLLLDYVHQDMEKSSAIEKEKDELLLALKESKQREKDAKKAFEELEFSVRQNAYSKVIDASALDAKQKGLHENIDGVERELELTRHNLSRKEAEANELSKMQMELLEKMKEKEISYQKVCLDLKSLKKSIRDAANFRQGSTDSSDTDIGALMTTVHIEIQNLRHQIDDKDSEMRSLKQQIDTKNREIVELRTQSTVDEAVAIVEDRNRLSKEVDELRSDLAYFKTLELTLADLNEVLLSKLRSNEIKSSGSSNILSKFNKSASLSPTKSNISSPGGSIYRREVAASSQEHAVWTMLPQIRQLCLPLYECIQKIFQDFHTKELETVELLATVDSLQRNVTGITQKLADEIEDRKDEKQKFVKLKDDMNMEIEKLELENSRGKAAQAILDQVKYILQSLPGSVFGNIDNSFQKPSESFQSADDSFDLPSVSGSHFRPSDTRGFSSFIEHMRDEHLPDILGKVLLKNFNAMNTLAEARIDLKTLKMEKEQLTHELAAIQDENSILKKSTDSMSSQFYYEQEGRQAQEKKLSTDLEAALELIEKQNALAMSFEAKIEALKRDRQVRVAQVTTLQQREEHNRKLLIGVVNDFWEEFIGVSFARNVYIDMGLGLSSNRQVPKMYGDEKFPDAVRTVSEVLSKLFHALVRSNSRENQEPSVLNRILNQGNDRSSSFSKGPDKQSVLMETTTAPLWTRGGAGDTSSNFLRASAGSIALRRNLSPGRGVEKPMSEKGFHGSAVAMETSAIIGDSFSLNRRLDHAKNNLSSMRE